MSVGYQLYNTRQKICHHDDKAMSRPAAATTRAIHLCPSSNAFMSSSCSAAASYLLAMAHFLFVLCYEFKLCIDKLHFQSGFSCQTALTKVDTQRKEEIG